MSEESEESKAGREFNKRSKDEQERRNKALDEKEEKEKAKEYEVDAKEWGNPVEKVALKGDEEDRLKGEDVLLEKGAEL